MSGFEPWVVPLALTGLTLLLLAPVTSSLWFLAVIILVVHRRQPLGPGWRWFSGVTAAQWAGLALFELTLWVWRGPFAAYVAALLGLAAGAALALFARHFPASQPHSRQEIFATRLGLALVPLAMFSLGLLFLTAGWY